MREHTQVWHVRWRAGIWSREKSVQTQQSVIFGCLRRTGRSKIKNSVSLQVSITLQFGENIL